MKNYKKRFSPWIGKVRNCLFFFTYETHLDRIKVLGPICSRNHMYNLIVPVISQFDIIPVVISHHFIPFLFGNNCIENNNNNNCWYRINKCSKQNLQAEASIAPRSQIIKQFLEQVLPNSKNVFSIWIMVFRRFSWNLYAKTNNDKKQSFIFFNVRLFKQKIILMKLVPNNYQLKLNAKTKKQSFIFFTIQLFKQKIIWMKLAPNNYQLKLNTKTKKTCCFFCAISAVSVTEKFKQ